MHEYECTHIRLVMGRRFMQNLACHATSRAPECGVLIALEASLGVCPIKTTSFFGGQISGGMMCVEHLQSAQDKSQMHGRRTCWGVQAAVPQQQTTLLQAPPAGRSGAQTAEWVPCSCLTSD